MGLFSDTVLTTIGVTGAIGAGKTIFGLLVDPSCKRGHDGSANAEPGTLVVDDENSSAPYMQMFNFDRWSVAALRAEAKCKPEDFWPWFVNKIAAIKTGRYRVLMLDTIDSHEQSVADHVRAYPEKFGKTRAQWDTMTGVMMQTVKDEIKRFLDIATERFEVVVYTAHQRRVWEGNKPTTRLRPQGKDTWMKLAALYVNLDRPLDAKTGQQKAVPDGVVMKSRLIGFLEDGEIGPLLPPRVSPCTPDRIRAYIASPPNPKRLKESEKAHVEMEDGEIVRPLSEDDKRMLEVELFEKQTAANKTALDLLEARRRVVESSASHVVAPPATTVSDTKGTSWSPFPGNAPGANPVGAPKEPAPPATESQPRDMNGHALADLIELKGRLGMTAAAFDAALRKNYGVDSPSRLTAGQLADAVSKLRAAVEKKSGK